MTIQHFLYPYEVCSDNIVILCYGTGIFSIIFLSEAITAFWHKSGIVCIILVLCHFMVYFVAGCITFNISCLKWSLLKEIVVTFLSKGHLLPAVFPGDQQSKYEIRLTH